MFHILHETSPHFETVFPTSHRLSRPLEDAFLTFSPLFIRIMLTDLVERTHEQMWTSAETARRRLVAVGDDTVKFGQRLLLAGERLREIAEPAALDLRDYVEAACHESTPFNKLRVDDRNTLIEVYLATAIMLLGLSFGESAGYSSFITYPISVILPTWTAVALVALLPARLALTFRKQAMDDSERRSSIFATAFAIGVLGSYLLGGQRLLALGPSLLFLVPMSFSLLLDGDLLKTGSFESRQNLMFTAAGASLAVSSVLGYIIGARSFGALLFIVAHATFLSVHAQITTARLNDKALCPGLAQLLYVVGIFILQVIFAFVFFPA